MTYKDYLLNKKSYQESGALFLLERKHACLFYKPGKGKTYPCIDAIRDIDIIKNGEAKILILSTSDAIKNMWKSEIVSQKILPKNTTLLSFTAAIQSKTKNQLLAEDWDCIVVDECHKIKANGTKISKLVYTLTKYSEYAFGLSGTPRGNSDIDIFCQFHNLNVGEWGQVSYTSFKNNCCAVDRKMFGNNTVDIVTGILSYYQPIWEKTVSMYSQRIDYEEYDNMPDIEVKEVLLPYKPTKEYKDAENNIIMLPDYETTMTKLVAVLKLQQIVNGFLYIEDENVEKEEKRKVYKIEDNIKLNWLLQNITPNSIIVYRFTEDLNQLLNTLNNYKCTENVEEFKNGDAEILLLQCSRCESFNLQNCDRIIFYTMDYSFIKYDQMIHRVWRMGQKNKVQVEILIFNDTIETKIWDAVRKKQKFADLFMSIKG